MRKFIVEIGELTESKSIPLLVWYCCDNPEARDISVLPDGAAVRRPCVSCMMAGDVFLNGEISGEMPVWSTMMITYRSLELPKTIQEASRMEIK